jgi:hypothetical protein
VGQGSNKTFDAPDNKSRRSQTEINQRRDDIDLREEKSIDQVLPARHGHPHVGSRMVRAVESPEPRHFMMETVIPILGQIVGDADDEEAPEERYPAESIFPSGQQYGQKLQAEVGNRWPHD